MQSKLNGEKCKKSMIITDSRVILHILVFHNKFINNNVENFNGHNITMYLITCKVAFGCLL